MPPKTSQPSLVAGLFAALTVGVMALFFNLYEPWQPIGPELIPDGGFTTPAAASAWSGWNEWTQRTEDGGFDRSPGAVLTASSNQHGILRFTVGSLTNIPAFRVTLRAAAEGVVPGHEKYNLPRAIFFYHDAKTKSLFNLHHGIMTLPKNTGWKEYKDFFPVPADAVDARLHIQNLGSAGLLRIDDVSVIPVRERPSAPWWKLFFGLLWTAAFAYSLLTLKPWARRHGVLILATATLILIGIVLPGKLLDTSIEKTARAAKSMLRPAAPPAPAAVQAAAQPAPAKPAPPKKEVVWSGLAGTLVDRVHCTGHFALFSLLAFLTALSWMAAPPTLRQTAAVLAGLLLFAAATETLQFITVDRAAALSDLRIDSTGMTGAVILVLLLRGTQHLLQKVRR